MAVEEKTKAEELICKRCIIKRCSKAGVKECKVHGVTNIDWKCNYCCKVALFSCHRYGYFCAECHKTPNNPPIKNC